MLLLIFLIAVRSVSLCLFLVKSVHSVAFEAFPEIINKWISQSRLNREPWICQRRSKGIRQVMIKNANTDLSFRFILWHYYCVRVEIWHLYHWKSSFTSGKIWNAAADRHIAAITAEPTETQKVWIDAVNEKQRESQVKYKIRESLLWELVFTTE